MLTCADFVALDGQFLKKYAYIYIYILYCSSVSGSVQKFQSNSSADVSMSNIFFLKKVEINGAIQWDVQYLKVIFIRATCSGQTKLMISAEWRRAFCTV